MLRARSLVAMTPPSHGGGHQCNSGRAHLDIFLKLMGSVHL